MGHNWNALGFLHSKPLCGVLTLEGQINRVVLRPAGMARLDDENLTCSVESGVVYEVIPGALLRQSSQAFPSFRLR